jgi:hypothetical protein
MMSTNSPETIVIYVQVIAVFCITFHIQRVMCMHSTVFASELVR